MASRSSKYIAMIRNTLEANSCRRKDLLIDCRNRQVSSVISSNYRSDTGDDAGAAVYCVSNRMYMRHLRGYDKTDTLSVPTMTIEQTQIPAICSHIYVLPSKGRTASLDHHVRVTIPTLLSIVQMSCSTTTLARANHLVGIVKKSRVVCASTKLFTIGYWQLTGIASCDPNERAFQKVLDCRC